MEKCRSTTHQKRGSQDKAETELWAWDMELVDDITYGMSM